MLRHRPGRWDAMLRPSTDLTLRAQVLTYSRSRGLFLGVSLSGAVIRQDQADTQAFYGKDWTFYSLLNGQVAAPPDAQGLLNTVEKYAPTPKVRAQASPAAVPTAASNGTPAANAAPVTTATPATAPTGAPAVATDPATDSPPDLAPSPTAATPPEPSSSSLPPNNGSGHR